MPVATECCLYARGSRNEDIGLAGFNFLDGADVQIGHFRQLFLSDARFIAETPNIPTEGLQLLFYDSIHYGILWRKEFFDSTA